MFPSYPLSMRYNPFSTRIGADRVLKIENCINRSLYDSDLAEAHSKQRLGNSSAHEWPHLLNYVCRRLASLAHSQRSNTMPV